VDTIVCHRALLDFYLKLLQIPVTTAHPFFIMTGYNAVNGTSCAENPDLITSVLPHEWGFEGIVTDWGGEYD
jgi:beta-glucosidase